MSKSTSDRVSPDLFSMYSMVWYSKCNCKTVVAAEIVHYTTQEVIHQHTHTHSLKRHAHVCAMSSGYCHAINHGYEVSASPLR